MAAYALPTGDMLIPGFGGGLAVVLACDVKLCVSICPAFWNAGLMRLTLVFCYRVPGCCK